MLAGATTNYQLPNPDTSTSAKVPRNVAERHRLFRERSTARQCLHGQEAKEPPPMFEDSLIESAGVLKTKRPAATAISLLLQSLLVAAVAALPLLYTEALPRVSLTSLIAPGPPPPAPAPAPAQVEHRAAPPRESDLIGQRLREPQGIPRSIARIEESEVPMPAVPAGGPGVPGGTGDPSAANPLNAI